MVCLQLLGHIIISVDKRCLKYHCEPEQIPLEIDDNDQDLTNLATDSKHLEPIVINS